MKAAPLERELTDSSITVRPFTEDDAAALIAGRDAEFHRFLADVSDEPAPSGVIVDTNGTVIGWVDHEMGHDFLTEGAVNIGYNTLPPHRGQGVATRALRLLLDWLRDETPHTTATLLIDPANAASLAVARRAGCVQTGSVDGELRFDVDLN